MTLTYVLTAVVLIAYLVGVWILGGVLGLKSPDIWVLRGGLGLIGLGVAAAFIWWRRSRRQAVSGDTAEPVDSANEVDVLMRDADARLAAAKIPQGSRMANFPLIFLVGDPGSAKTSVAVNCGLEPELLAGQVYQESNIIPTRSANLWLTRNTILAEAGGRLLSERGLWTRAIRRARGGQFSSVIGKGSQAPRAALVCFDSENFTRQGVEASVAAARALHDRLAEISAALGINFPVYVLFTRMDRLPYFREFVRNLSNDEATQALGATLPLIPQQAAVYGEQQGARVGGAFDRLVRGLCDARPGLLARENDQGTQPATYEFPREFRKLRGVIVQFLVELCRPSQLTTAPFLRGFYFSGVRPVVVNEIAPADALAPEAHGMDAPSGATGIFHAGQRRPAASAPQRVAGTRKVAQWLFLTHLFHDILLQDRAALATSSSSTRTSFARRVLLASSCAICLIASTGFLVSWIRNRGLESRALEAARGISAGESTGQDLPSLEALQRLDTLRLTLAEIGAYERDGAPWSLRWGLYTGSDVYPEARRVYFARFKQLLFGQTQATILAGLQRLPSLPGPQDEYGPAYDMLKAYLITTSHHDKSTRPFLPPVLMRHWSAGRNIDTARNQLAQLQFEFYSDELKAANPYTSDNEGSTVERGRRYLSQFGGTERVYRNMLGEAGRNNPSLQFNRRFPGSAETVLDTYEVAGAFSKGGWDFMQDALRHADRYFSGEQWVLGDQTTASFDRGRVEQQLRDRYVGDFIGQWRAYMKAATVVKYASVQDAAKKLTQLSGNQSPLLALFWLAAQNTAVDEPKITNAFQPVHTVVPPTSVDRYIAPPNQAYVGALQALQASLESAAAQPGPVSEAAAAPVLANATTAKSASRAVGQAFRPDAEGRVDAMSQKLLEDPITYVEALLRTLGPAELNGKGKGLCGQLRPLYTKYPFNPAGTQQATLAEVNAILRKPDGALWQLYDTSLQKVLPRQGNQYMPVPSGGITLTPAFVAWFNRMAALSEALYAGGAQDPRLVYTLRPILSEGVTDMTLRLDGQVLTGSTTNTPKQFVWPGTVAREAKASVKFGGGDLGWINSDGLWAVFQFFGEAKRWQPAGPAWLLEWVVRSGKTPFTLQSGRPLTVRFELNMNGAPPLFEKGYLSKLGCVAEIAK